MTIGRIKQAFIGVTLAGAAASLGGCATVHNLNTTSCVKTDSSGPRPGLFPLLEALIPSYHNVRPSMPCIDSQFFMALADIARMPQNANNHHLQGSVVAYYDEMAKDAKGGDKKAAQTVAMIDERLQQQNITIDNFRDSYERNRPQTLDRAQETSCWRATVRVNGELVDERICGMDAFRPSLTGPALR